MRPVISFPESKIQNARLEGFQMSLGEAKGIDIVADAVPGRGSLELKPAQLLYDRVRMDIWFESGIGADGAFFVLDDPIEGVPRRERGHLVGLQSELPLEKLQNRGIRVALLVVTVDDIVVGLAGKNLGISGVREPIFVGHLDGTSKIAVAGNRAVALHERAPKERHDFFSSLLRRGRPVFLVKRRFFRGPFFRDRLQNLQVETAEDLLVPRAIKRDQDEIGRLFLSRAVTGRRDKKGSCSEPENKPYHLEILLVPQH